MKLAGTATLISLMFLSELNVENKAEKNMLKLFSLF